MREISRMVFVVFVAIVVMSALFAGVYWLAAQWWFTPVFWSLFFGSGFYVLFRLWK